MTSFPFEIDERSEAAARFISAARRELLQAFIAAKDTRGLTQASIAQRLGVDPSVISRQLGGEANLTLRSIAELSWAMELEPRLVLAPAPQEADKAAPAEAEASRG